MSEELNEPAQVTPARAGPLLARLADRAIGRPLLIHPSKMEVVLHVLEGRIGIEGALGPLPADASRFVGTTRRETRSGGMAPIKNGVAIITIEGSLVNRGAWIGTDSGLVSYEGIAAQLRDVRDDQEVKAVILDIDSPGGEATGMYAVAQLVKEVNAVKPVVAVVNDMAASAGYGIAANAREIIVSPTSIVGSIGVVMTHIDRSGEMANKGLKATFIYAGAHKVDGNAYGPLSDSVRADLQNEVAKFYDQFVGLVAGGRGKKLDADMARATEARVYLGQEAVDKGLADRVASFDAILAELSKTPTAKVAKSKGVTSMSGNTEATPQAENAGITQADLDAARVAGATAERQRCKAILTSPEAEGRQAQARFFAFESDVSETLAGQLLSAQPREQTGPRIPTIAERAAEAESAGFGGDSLPKAGADIDAAFGKAVSNINAARGK